MRIDCLRQLSLAASAAARTGHTKAECDTDLDVFERVFYNRSLWGRDPILPRAGYQRLVAGLVSGGFVRGTAFETAVDNSLAEQAVAADPPAMA